MRRFVEFRRLQGAFDRRNAEIAWEHERTQAQQRHVLELHDRVVQALSVAHLALRTTSRGPRSSRLSSRGAIVSRSLDELSRQEVPHEELIRDSALAL